MNPYVVARQVGTPALILAAWGFGGLVALAGAFVYAELASLRPAVGGQYAYLREAYSPRVAFLYGWVLLLVTQSGGMAAVAVTFARYLGELVPLPLPEAAVAVLALATLTAVNCLGVRAGNDVQSLLMVLKTVAILGLVAVGFVAFGGERVALRPVLDRPPSLGLLAAFGAALVPVLFAYGGWQTSGFVMGELKRPGARHAPGAPPGRGRRRRPLPVGQRGLPARARAPTASPRARLPPRTSCASPSASAAPVSSRWASRSPPSASSPRAS